MAGTIDGTELGELFADMPVLEPNEDAGPDVTQYDDLRLEPIQDDVA